VMGKLQRQCLDLEVRRMDRGGIPGALGQADDPVSRTSIPATQDRH
jgi:hypothetical protein